MYSMIEIMLANYYIVAVFDVIPIYVIKMLAPAGPPKKNSGYEPDCATSAVS